MANAAYQEWADAAATKYGIPTDLFRSLVNVESGWNPTAISPAGAYGLTQLMPGTAQDLGVNKYDPRSNLEGGAKYLAQMFAKFGNWTDALAAYNGGPGNYQLAETQQYAATVLAGVKDQSRLTQGTGYGKDQSRIAPEGEKSFADRLHDWLYGEGSARLSMGDNGQIQGTNAAGQTADISAPTQVTDFLTSLNKLFTLEFWKSIFTSAIGIVAIIALIAFGVYALLNQTKAVTA